MTQPVSNDDSIGRNVPCPCGSGKKYKRCHGKTEKVSYAVPKIAIDPARRNAAWAEQMKAAGMDPGQIDPNAMAGLQQSLAKMPKGQLARIQQLMQKAMAGKDVTKEAAELEKLMPPDFLQQMQAMQGLMGGADGMPGMPGMGEEAEEVEAEAAMSADEARKVVEKAVAEGKLSPEQAEQLLQGQAAEGSAVESDEKTKKSFWKKLKGGS